MAVESKDLAKAERTWERQEKARQSEVEMIAAYIAEHGEPPPDPTPHQGNHGVVAQEPGADVQRVLRARLRPAAGA